MYKKLLSLALALGMCLGLATPAAATSPCSIGKYRTLACSYSNFTAVIDDGGTLWMWGSNFEGVLGIGATYEELSYTATPQKVMDDVLSVSCGSGHVAALKRDGSLWTWGYDYDGQLGNGHTVNAGTAANKYQTVPVKMMDDVDYVQCGSNCTFAIKKDGSLWSWGQVSAKLGNGYTGNTRLSYPAQTVPTKIMDDVKTVRCSGKHAAAIKKDGSLWMWGNNGDGQLGTNGAGDREFFNIYTQKNEKEQTVPVKVMDHVADVYCLLTHTVIIKDDGSVWCCGTIKSNNKFHPYYDVMKDGVAVPVKTTLSDIASFSNYFYLKTDGTLWAWDFAVPGSFHTASATKVLDHVDSVDYGNNYVMAVRTDHTLWGWGKNGSGQLGVPMIKSDGYLERQEPVKVMDNVAISGEESKPEPTVGGFSDVKESDYFAQPVLWAVEKGVTSGTSANTFSPDQTCTTGQILTMIWAANGSPKTSGANPFTDVKESDYFYQAVLWAKEKGLVSGARLNGGNPCTRGSTVDYLWKLAGSPDAGTSKFADAGGYSRAVAWASSRGITGGTSDTTFSPGQTCTRGQIMTFLYKNFAG